MPISCLRKVKDIAKNNQLLLWSVAAIVAGIVVGLCLRLTEISYDGRVWLSIWGELFLRMLKMIILPLITSCLVTGIAGAESRAVGRLGVGTLSYVFATQLVGGVLGVVLTVLIQPGKTLSSDVPHLDKDMSLTDVATDFLRNFFPENIIQACIQHVYSTRFEHNITNDNISAIAVGGKTVYRDGMNTMGVVMFSILLGVGIHAGGTKAKPILSVFDALNVVIFNIMDLIILYSPIGMFSLIAGSLLQVENLEGALKSMGMFIVTVVTGLAIHLFMLLPLLYLATTRKNPFKLLLTVLDAILAAMAPPSSAAGFPYLIRRCDQTLKIDRTISNFVLPVCTTINRDGSALFISTAAVFVAQTYDFDLQASQYIVIILLVTLLSAAVAAVPSSSMLVLMMVTQSTGIPVAERLGLLMTTEWLLDRLRTGTNLASNAVGVAVIAHFCTPYLEEVKLENSDSLASMKEALNGDEREPLSREEI